VPAVDHSSSRDPKCRSPKAWELSHRNFFDALDSSHFVHELVVKSGVKDKQYSSSSSSSSSGFSNNSSGVGSSGSKYTSSRQEGSVRGGGLFGSLFGSSGSSSNRAISGTPGTSAATSSSSLSTSYEAAAAALGLQLEPAELTAAAVVSVPPPPPPTTATTPSTVPAVPLETVPEVIVLPRSASEGGAALAARLAALKQEQLNKLLRANFTAAHNSGSAKDSGSAFLGDELSVHNRNAFGALFARSNSTSSSSTSSSFNSTSSNSGQRPTVVQPLAQAATEPVLLSVAECAHWSAAPGCASSSGRDATAQHWIVPAVIAGFPAELLPLALQSAPRVPLCVNSNNSSSSSDYDSSNSSNSSNSNSGSSTAIDWFQCHELGSALVTRCDSRSRDTSSSSSSVPVQRRLLLRQNCLFEYAADHCTDTDAPIGYINLSKATVRYDAAAQPLVVHIAALETPVQSSATVQLVLQASTAAAAQQWAAVLQQAAVLCMESLYEQLTASAEGCEQMKRSASKANLEVNGYHLKLAKLGCLW
jgi:hypothetical protein